MRGKPLLAAGVSAAALAAVAVLFGGDVAVSGTAAAAPAPPVSAAGAAGAALPAAAPTTTAPPTTTPPTTPTPPAPSVAPRKPAAPAAQTPGTVRLRGGGEARLVRKDLGPDATLPVPESLREATWWGADPGAAGATVLAGHVNWRGRTGPFAELWDARTGDRVVLVDPAGKAWAYQVSEVLTMAKDGLPARADELFAQSGPHRLVLVTCGGRWVGGADGYSSNRIVVALPA